jgi:TPR repeat protein
MFKDGQGVKQDFGEAVRWYRKAADQGHAIAQINLGSMFKNGQGVKQDFSEAMRWYRKAADQGHVDAQLNLGIMFESGQGVKQDFGEAKRWYRKAADRGNSEAETCVLRMEEMLRERQQTASPAAPANPLSFMGACANCGASETTGSVTLKPCSRCKAVAYCGKACQAQHWKAGGHRAVCK